MNTKRSIFLVALILLFALLLQASPPAPGVEMDQSTKDFFGQIRPDYKSGGLYRALQRQGAERTQLSFIVPVVCGRFTDYANTYSTTQFDNLLFENNPNGTMSEYYYQISEGNFSLTGDVYGFYTSANNQVYYANDTNDNAGATFAYEMAVAGDAVINYAQYDNDGPDNVPNSGDDDGYVDVFVVVHAGMGAESGHSATSIWSHRWNFNSASYYSAPNVPGEYTTNDISANGGYIRINDYMIQPEKNSSGGLIEIGVYCHEFGHALGLPDLYDTDNSSEGIGQWCLMSSGSWGGDGSSPETPVEMSAWCKKELGWLNITEVTTFENNVQLQKSSSNNAYKLPIGSLEYFLIENRHQSGWDANIPVSGLAIYHVDDAMSNNTNENHYMVALEQADGQLHMENNINRGDAGDLFPGTSNSRTFDTNSNPSSHGYNGSATDIAVTSISNGGETMTFNVTNVPLSLIAEPESADFGLVTHADSDTFITITLLNSSSSSCIVTGVSGANPPFSTSYSSSFSIPGYSSGQISVILDRSVATGSYSGNVTIYNTLNEISIPVSAEISNEQIIFYDGFETYTGWALTGEFQRGAPQGLGGDNGDHGSPDPASAYSGSYVLGTDLTGLGTNLGDYEVNVPDRGYQAVSPTINCTGYTDTKLNFKRWLNVERDQYDNAYLDISNDNGTTWTNIWQNDYHHIEDEAWRDTVYDISSYADGQSQVKVRFCLGETDDTWFFSGWNIDEFKIIGEPLAVALSVSPSILDFGTFRLGTTSAAQEFTGSNLIQQEAIVNITCPEGILIHIGDNNWMQSISGYGIPSQSQSTFYVSYTPSATGDIEEFLTINQQSPSSAEILLQLDSNVFFSVPLIEGWNVFCNPLIPASGSFPLVSDIFGNETEIFYYNDDSGLYESHPSINNVPYWVHLDNSQEVFFEGEINPHWVVRENPPESGWWMEINSSSESGSNPPGCNYSTYEISSTGYSQTCGLYESYLKTFKVYWVKCLGVVGPYPAPPSLDNIKKISK